MIYEKVNNIICYVSPLMKFDKVFRPTNMLVKFIFDLIAESRME